MAGQRYRLKTATLAILEHKGHRIPITIPLGGVVQLVDGALNGERWVDVEWESKHLLMFTMDLHDRGEIVASA